MSVSRRSILKAGVTASVTAMAAKFEPFVLQAQSGSWVRWNATSPEGRANLAKYARAVGIMKDPSKYAPTDPRSWHFQWYTHWIPGPSSPWPAVAQAKKVMIDKVYAGVPSNNPHRQLAELMWDDCQAHGYNPSDPNFYQEMYFCVWHRLYVYYFEQIIRHVLQDNTFALPYWDYLSGNVSDLSIPPEFRDQSSPLFQPNRNTWVNQGERIDKQNPGAMNLRALNETFYINSPDGNTGFCPLFDGNPHGQVHVMVGNQSNMGDVPTAANDPVFWVHHCNIDRLWESWNRIPGRTNPSWPNRWFPFATADGTGIATWPVNANRVSQLNYSYSSYYTPPNVRTAPTPEATVTFSAAASTVTRAKTAEAVTLSGDRARTSLAPLSLPMGAAPATPEAPFTLSGANKQLYLTLGSIAAPAGTQTTYNVYLDLPADSTVDSVEDPHYVGTLTFFGAGHGDHAGGHPVTFNVTETVEALRAKKELSASPTVTLVRRGDAPAENPTVGQMVLVES